MMTAATTMMSQAGEIDPRYTPADEVAAPATPSRMPNLGRQLRARMWVTAPASDMGMMAKSEVAVAMNASSP